MFVSYKLTIYRFAYVDIKIKYKLLIFKTKINLILKKNVNFIKIFNGVCVYIKNYFCSFTIEFE